MKYETPQLTTLAPAINAIQTLKASEGMDSDSPPKEPPPPAYEDWED
jgi:hypothetical protein